MTGVQTCALPIFFAGSFVYIDDRHFGIPPHASSVIISPCKHISKISVGFGKRISYKTPLTRFHQKLFKTQPCLNKMLIFIYSVITGINYIGFEIREPAIIAFGALYPVFQGLNI